MGGWVGFVACESGSGFLVSAVRDGREGLGGRGGGFSMTTEKAQKNIEEKATLRYAARLYETNITPSAATPTSSGRVSER